MSDNEGLPKEAWEQAAQLAALSHEFKTPLSVALATLDLMQKKMRPMPEFYTDEYDMLFNIAGRNIHKVLRMINNLIDSQRLLDKVETLRYNDEDVVRILRQAEESVAPMLQTRGARINCVCKTQEPFFAECDAQALDRVLLNLISNAIKHLPQSNGRILLTLETVQGTREQGEMMCISVTDNGSGVSKEAMPHLFERYWHDESESSVDKTSTGLGLFIVKSLVEMHGGTITVQSEPYMTTTFVVMLPMRQNQQGESGMLRSYAMPYETESYELMLRQEMSDFI